MKSFRIKTIISYLAMGINIILMGLLIPIVILALLLSVIWAATDKFISWLEGVEKNA